VKPGNLVKRARRELTRSPKKAAVLVLMCAVAAYYWVPIVRGWTGTSPAGHTSSAEPEGSWDVGAKLADHSETESPNGKPAPRWTEVVHWIENDPLTQPAVLPSGARDPFQRATQPSGLAEDESGSAVPAVKDWTPERLGMVLNGTIVGRRCTAIVNGRAYPIHAVVRVTVPQGTGETVAFRVVRIEEDRVELERDGQVFQLRMAAPGLAGGAAIQSEGDAGG
jgi:hypothetical protein